MRELAGVLRYAKCLLTDVTIFRRKGDEDRRSFQVKKYFL